MISDEPDEDADLLDDDALIEAATGPVTKPSILDSTPAPADWPPRACQAAETLTVDGDILAWFRARDTNWQPHIHAVLRAWIAARTPRGT
jgi:hypothetical protein